MFLLNRKVEMLVLISVIGILLPTVFIQPAQAFFFGSRLECYYCENCRNDTLGAIKRCRPMDTYCVWGEREYPDGTRIGIRDCGAKNFVERSGYNCDTFQPELKSSFCSGSYHTGDKIRVCSCQGNLCNNQYTESHPPHDGPNGRGQASGRNAHNAENATSSFTSPQPLVVAVSVCVSGFLVTK